MEFEDSRDNFNLIVDRWVNLGHRLQELRDLIHEIRSVCPLVLDVVGNISVMQDLQGPAFQFILDWDAFNMDLQDFNFILTGVPGQSLNLRYPAFFTRSGNYTWIRQGETCHFDDALSLNDRLVTLFIQRARQLRDECQQISRGVTRFQRLYRSRYYAPEQPGARRAATEFRSRRFTQTE